MTGRRAVYIRQGIREPCFIQRTFRCLDYKQAIDLKEFHNILFNFLNRYENIHIVADWPEDFSLFLTSLIIKQGSCMITPKLTMELWNSDASLAAESRIPHNALQDAFALKRKYVI